MSRRLPAICATFLLAGSPAAGQAPDSTEIDWSGYVQLFGHAPADGEGRIELYTLGIGVDVATTGIAGERFGFHGLVRIRDTELREFYDTTAATPTAPLVPSTPTSRPTPRRGTSPLALPLVLL